MSEVNRENAARVGVDLAKRVLQVHAVDAAGRPRHEQYPDDAIEVGEREVPAFASCLVAAQVFSTLPD